MITEQIINDYKKLPAEYIKYISISNHQQTYKQLLKEYLEDWEYREYDKMFGVYYDTVECVQIHVKKDYIFFWAWFLKDYQENNPINRRYDYYEIDKITESIKEFKELGELIKRKNINANNK